MQIKLLWPDLTKPCTPTWPACGCALNHNCGVRHRDTGKRTQILMNCWKIQKQSTVNRKKLTKQVNARLIRQIGGRLAASRLSNNELGGWLMVNKFDHGRISYFEDKRSVVWVIVVLGQCNLLFHCLATWWTVMLFDHTLGRIRMP